MDSTISKAVFKLTHNGTTDHAVNTASATNLVSGAAFTPTPGNLLVAIVYGSVTVATPTGWTIDSPGGSAVNNGGLYAFHKAATTGDNLFTLTTAVTDFSLALVVYEFPSGSVFGPTVSGTNLEAIDPNPMLSGLSGTNLVIAVKASGMIDGEVWSTADWTGATEDVDFSDVFTTTEGWGLSIGFTANYASATWQPTCTVTRSGGNQTLEGLTFAISVGAGEATPLSTPVVTVSATADPSATGAADGTVTVTWPAVANADHYEAGIVSGLGQTSGFTIVSSAATSPYTFTGLEAGDYTVAIRAIPAS